MITLYTHLGSSYNRFTLPLRYVLTKQFIIPSNSFLRSSFNRFKLSFSYLAVKQFLVTSYTHLGPSCNCFVLHSILPTRQFTIASKSFYNLCATSSIRHWRILLTTTTYNNYQNLFLILPGYRNGSFIWWLPCWMNGCFGVVYKYCFCSSETFRLMFG